ncbi:uncharacterized protein K452DRAFT_24634 [Aplosporella prunicola CBS 121167]|uniref:Uncharacterized protein n=1 Tax=Aplosporella prunicola CBS 121167 TaxID=1176127 RepID=A0A6A6BFJ1_9PEZI|nr:uncharacterized protein K452DRAFT_24634 [Aplosporella prunicola CBS 121167]KAF2142004.1 hypothetical protein K452DRAFT_24634 [Aplosporella prunicola CBS 121167]
MGLRRFWPLLSSSTPRTTAFASSACLLCPKRIPLAGPISNLPSAARAFLPVPKREKAHFETDKLHVLHARHPNTTRQLHPLPPNVLRSLSICLSAPHAQAPLLCLPPSLLCDLPCPAAAATLLGGEIRLVRPSHDLRQQPLLNADSATTSRCRAFPRRRTLFPSRRGLHAALWYPCEVA